MDRVNRTARGVSNRGVVAHDVKICFECIHGEVNSRTTVGDLCLIQSVHQTDREEGLVYNDQTGNLNVCIYTPCQTISKVLRDRQGNILSHLGLKGKED